MSNNWCNRQPMKKSIVRNVDVKRQPKPAEQVVKIPDNSTIKLPKVYHKDTQDYSVPQKNTLIDMRKKLDDFNEYKNAESEFLQKTKEKIAQMQGFNNKEISNQLNFPPNVPIYKNLPPIYDPEKSRKADNLIKQTKKKIESTTSTKTNSKEINDLLRQLVDLEYQEKELTSTESNATSKMIGEDEYFGLDKFNELHLQLPSNKEDNVQFINDTIKKTEDEIFKSDYYSDFIPFHKRPKLPKNELCGCSRKKYEQERALKAQQS